MNVPFAEADLASHKRARTLGRISTTFMRKVVLRWTSVCSFCLSRQWSTYVARKDLTNPTLLVTRKLRTARRRVQSNLVLTIVSESQRKLVLRNTATFAKSMGAEWINPVSVPLRKAERNPIPQIGILRNKARKWTSSRR
jgi:uncharacterized phosphosugar-binding protein